MHTLPSIRVELLVSRVTRSRVHTIERRHLQGGDDGGGPVAVADPALFQWQVAQLANAGVDDQRKNGAPWTA